MNYNYRYDLYRRLGRYTKWDLIKSVLMQPKYKVVFWKRMCERTKHRRILYGFPRIIYERMMIKYGVDMGATTEVGEGFVIRHIGGIAINNQVKIGNNVEVLQGVTIGAEERGKRAGVPIIGDRVWIGSNAVIVGNIRIGNNVLIAANSFVNFDVPDNSIVIGNPGKAVHNEHATEGYIKHCLTESEANSL